MLHRDSVIVAGGMVKSIHRSTLEAFESIVGLSPTSLAKKKARLIHPSFDPSSRSDRLRTRVGTSSMTARR
ncbi:MAG: hypothetical protein R2710_20220 [Acidimicrobiales bacterium]